MPQPAKTVSTESARSRRDWRHVRQQQDRICYQSTRLLGFLLAAMAIQTMAEGAKGLIPVLAW